MDGRVFVGPVGSGSKIGEASRHVFSDNEAEANARLFAASKDLLAAVDVIFPADDWAAYDGVTLPEKLTVTLTMTKRELFALRDAIAKANEGGR